MNVDYSATARGRDEQYELLRQATRQLEEVLGGSAAPTRAEWDRSEDAKGLPLYTLKLNDFTGEVETSFTPQELSYPGYVRARLYRLWGDLLQARSDQQLRKVQDLVSQLEGD